MRIVQYALPKHLESQEEAGVITDWYEDELSSIAQAEFDRVLRSLAKLPLAEWDRPLYGVLTHRGERFGEVRFAAQKKKYRPMGIVVPREFRQDAGIEEFAIVVGAYKKMKVWTPRSALDAAVKRILDIKKNGRRNLREYTSHFEI
ncbi:MAG: hypothetical protein ACYC7A_20120 [Thermoanaerobaculia bacterium]